MILGMPGDVLWFVNRLKFGGKGRGTRGRMMPAGRGIREIGGGKTHHTTAQQSYTAYRSS